MTILDQIVAYKYQEVEKLKALHPVAELEKSLFFSRQPISLKEGLLKEELFGIIAEFKRRSPSKGIMNKYAIPEKVCHEYIQAGSSAVSVLTDSEFFGGSSADLIEVRKKVYCPVLRKDFIIDEYQIIEARSIGADAVLLITELHRSAKLEKLHRFARSLELEVLVEVHDEKNISRIPYDAQLVGINSRDLSSFRVSFDHLTRLVHLLPEETVKVAESGIRTVHDYVNLENAGFDAFLIGELFMNTHNPGETCKTFINEIREIRNLSEVKEQKSKQ
jgi:indole-3-glycerol phosphate synthase